MGRVLIATLLLVVLAAAPASAARPVVAVIDTGVDDQHPALRGLLWRNPEEIPRNRRDDDLNGFVDDINGADWVGHDGRPYDRQDHGTHVAGIIARRPMVGRRRGAPTGARIMALRVADRDGIGTTEDLAAAIIYATSRGADIINLSVGYYQPSALLADALLEAEARGVLVVVAAGNRGEDLSTTPVYPASYNLPGMLVVGAASGGGLAWWSGRGASVVDVAAPASAVSTVPFGKWARMTGTSQATAFVSRAAVLLWAERPWADAAGIRAALLSGVQSR